MLHTWTVKLSFFLRLLPEGTKLKTHASAKRRLLKLYYTKQGLGLNNVPLPVLVMKAEKGHSISRTHIERKCVCNGAPASYRIR